MRSSSVLALFLAGCVPENELNKADGAPFSDTGASGTDSVPTADSATHECPPLDVGASAAVATDAECLAGSVDDPWNVVIDYEYSSPGIGTCHVPAVGDLDGDGLPEVALTDRSGFLSVIDGVTGSERLSVSDVYGWAGVVIADVDADGVNELVYVEDGCDDFQCLVARELDGEVEWRSRWLDRPTMELTAADLDADGMPEIIADAYAFNGEDGTFVLASQAYDGVSAGRSPVVADIDLDGVPEVLIGAGVYSADGTLRFRTEEHPLKVFATVVQADADPEGEVFMVSQTQARMHDTDGTVLFTLTLPGQNDPSPPCVADFDGDGTPEIGVANVDMLTLFELDGTVVWSLPIDDTSGRAGCSAFDFDADGSYEMLYADESDFWIRDGATGDVLFDDPDHTSGTLYEYPVIADLDGDGSPEILVAENDEQGLGRMGVTVYTHAAGAWPAVGHTWGIHDFAITNQEEDGSVPVHPAPFWGSDEVFHGRRVTPTTGVDLLVTITDVCVINCDGGPAALSFQVANQGSVDAPAGLNATVYAADDPPRAVATITLPAVPAGTRLDGIEVDLTAADVGAEGWEVRVDDDGAGVGRLVECDESNNTARSEGVSCE